MIIYIVQIWNSIENQYVFYKAFQTKEGCLKYLQNRGFNNLKIEHLNSLNCVEDCTDAFRNDKSEEVIIEYHILDD